MEAILIYFAKASLLITIYFLAYHFLLRKETFFTPNRWFLLLGLATSATLPLFFIKKFIVVPQPEFTPEQLVALSNTPMATVTQENPINWFLIGLGLYIIIAGILFFKVLGNIFSLFKLLHKKEIIRRNQFALIDINENISPFSFFNYIVFNSSYYTNDELQSILLHEKVHSQERHSIDILIARLFCIAFWFNPFMWLYKKAMIQNLEYIADSKASKLFEDKKVYQKALLKVVTHQNCLAITNHFYQSLIKNRIVMLNKNQSQKRNSWKYALILPALAIFMLLFQVKTIAQDRIISRSAQGGLHITTDKNSSDEEMKNDAKIAKEKFGVAIKFSKVKRNSNGEITGIKIEFKDANGKTGMTHIQGDEPIKPIHFQKSNDRIGFGGRSNEVRIAHGEHPNNLNDEKSFGFSFLGDDDDSIVDIEKIVIPNIPEIAETPEVDGIHPPDAPNAAKIKSFNKSIVISKRNNGKPEIIINGKKLDVDSEEYKKMAEDFDGKLELKMNEDGPMVFKFNDDQVFKFNPGDVDKVTREAIEKSRIQVEKMRERMEKMRPDMEKMKIDIEKVKPEDFNFDFRWDDKENSNADIKKAREEMMKAKEEMMKARDEMIKARDEMIKSKSEVKTKKA